MTTITINDDWAPTAENINALPDPVQRYIMQLVTHMDPAFTLQQLAEARDLIAQLQAALAIEKAFGR